MNKSELKNKMIQIHQEIISELQNKIEVVHSMVDIDEFDTIDIDDSSHQFESQEMEGIVRSQLNKEIENLSLLKSLDFSEKYICVPGSIVKTKDFNFIIGISTMPFDFEEEHYIGISVNSPIYKELCTASIGQEFIFRGNNYTIESIN